MRDKTWIKGILVHAQVAVGLDLRHGSQAVVTVSLVKLLRKRSVCFSFAGVLVSYVRILRGQLLRDRRVKVGGDWSPLFPNRLSCLKGSSAGPWAHMRRVNSA